MNAGFGDSRSEGQHVRLGRPVQLLGSSSSSHHRVESSAGTSLKSFGTNSSHHHHDEFLYPLKLQPGSLSGTKSLHQCWPSSKNKLVQPPGKEDKLGKDDLQPQKQVVLGRDLLDLISKKSFNPLTIEPASDVSFSDTSSFLSFGHASTDSSIAEKPEFVGHELQASSADIEQALEQLEDEEEEEEDINEDNTMNAESIPANVIAWDLQAQHEHQQHLEMTASNKTALLRRPSTSAVVDSSMIMSKVSSVGFQAEKLVPPQKPMDEAISHGGSAGTVQPEVHEDALSCHVSATEKSFHDDGSYTFEDLVAATTSDVNDISSLRRSSAMSGGSRSGLTELDVTAHSRYASETEEADSSDIPSEDIATDVMSTRSGMTDLDMTAHNRSSSFVIEEELEVGVMTSSSDPTDSDVSSSCGSAHGSDNSSMAALQELMQIFGKESDHDISDHEDEAGGEPMQILADDDSSVEESIDELQHLMNIMDSSDGADLSNADVGDEDVGLYEQALADSLLYENKLKPKFRENLMKSSNEYASDKSMSLHMSTRSMSTSRLHNDSFVKHLLNMEISDNEIKECGGGGDRRGSASGSMTCRSIFSTKEEKKEVEETFSPNRPHPSLEYPPLYFMLRRFPWLFDNIKILYLLRWRMSYPLQRRLPYSRLLRKAGVNLTWGELLLLLPFFAMLICGIVYSFVIPNVAVSGKVARFGLIGALLFAQRNSVVTLLIGMPLDRSIFYHKLAGRLGGVTGILHTISFFLDPVFREKHSGDALGGGFDTTVNASGSMIMIFMIGIVASSISRVRRQMYEVFYYLHLFFAVGMIVSAYFHSGVLIPCLAASISGFDVFVRSVVMARTRYPRKAELAIVSDTVIELRFPKTAGFCYNPGQYIYISVPELSWLQWHAFSISSSPKQKTVTLHIRVAGQWTSDLYQLARKTKEISILLEGPYGNVGVDILNDRKYKRIMLISGGIGSKCFVARASPDLIPLVIVTSDSHAIDLRAATVRESQGAS